MPTELSRKTIETSLRNSTLAGVVGIFFFMTIQNGPLPLMLEKLGAGGVAIGLTVTLFQLGMLAQVPATFFTERLRSRKPYWALSTILARLLIALPGLYLLLCPGRLDAATALTLSAIGVFSFVAQSSSPVWFGWMADLIPDDLRDTFWARRQGWVMAASVASVAFTGWFLDRFPETSFAGFGWLLLLASAMGVADIAIHWFVAEPPIPPPSRGLSTAERLARPLRNPDFLFFTLAMCAWYFGLGFFGPFLNVYLKGTFGTSYTHLAAIQLSGMLSSVVASFVGGHLIRTTGLRTYGLAMVLAAPLFSTAWFFLDGQATLQLPLAGSVPQPVAVLFATSLVAGGIYAAVGMLQLNLLSALAPLEGRTMAMAVHWSMVGLFSALGPLAGGGVKDALARHPIGLHLFAGTHFSYFHAILLLHALVVWGVVFPLLCRIRKQEGEWPLERAVAHIFVLSPLRTVRDLYGFNLAVGGRMAGRIADRFRSDGQG